MTPAWKWLYIDQFPTSFHILAINDFFVIRKKTKKLNYHFAQLPFLPRRRFPQIILLVSGSKYFLKVDGHFRTQIVRSRSFKNCNSLKHFSQTPSSVHCSQPLPHSKGWKKENMLKWMCIFEETNSQLSLRRGSGIPSQCCRIPVVLISYMNLPRRYFYWFTNLTSAVEPSKVYNILLISSLKSTIWNNHLLPFCLFGFPPLCWNSHVGGDAPFSSL